MNELDQNRKLILQKIISEIDDLTNLEASFRVELVGRIMEIVTKNQNLKRLRKNLNEVMNEARIQNEINFVQLTKN